MTMTALAAATAIAAAAIVGTYTYTSNRAMLSTVPSTAPLTRPLTAPPTPGYKPLTSPPTAPAYKPLTAPFAQIKVVDLINLAPVINGKTDETQRDFHVSYTMPATDVVLIISQNGKEITRANAVAINPLQATFALRVMGLKHASIYDYKLSAVAQGKPKNAIYSTGRFATGKMPAPVPPRSKPVVTNVALPTTTLTNGTMVLSRFNVVAAGSDVALKKISFKVSTANQKLVFSAPALREVGSGTNLAASVAVEGNASCGLSPTSKVDRCVVVRFSNELIIAAGNSKTFDLRMGVGGTVIGDSIATSVLRDDAAFIGTLSDPKSAYQKFLWSDLSAVPHSIASQDWYNGKYSQGLPTAPQTMVRK